MFNVEPDKISQNHTPRHVLSCHLENEPLYEKTCPPRFENLDMDLSYACADPEDGYGVRTPWKIINSIGVYRN